MKRLVIIGTLLVGGCYYPPPARYSPYPAYMPPYYEPPMGRYTYQPPTEYQPPPLTGGEQPPQGNDGPIGLGPPVQQSPLAPPSASIPPDAPLELGSPVQPSLPPGLNNAPAPAPFLQPPAEEQRPVNPALEVPDEQP